MSTIGKIFDVFAVAMCIAPGALLALDDKKFWRKLNIFIAKRKRAQVKI